MLQFAGGIAFAWIRNFLKFGGAFEREGQ